MSDRILYECPDCKSLWTSPLAAAECCSPAWEEEA